MPSQYTDANGVFLNKQGITDAGELRVFEYRETTLRAREILSGQVDLGVQGFGLARQQAIHNHLLYNVYDWSGKTRITPSSKRLDARTISFFADPDTIAAKWQALETKANAFATAQGLTHEQKVEALAGIFVEANHIHPFPEGNGRSLQVFMQQLAREQKVELDYTHAKDNRHEWNRASAVSGRHGRLFEHQIPIYEKPDLEPIKKMFAAMAGPSPAYASDKPAASAQTNDALRQEDIISGRIAGLKESPVQGRFDAEHLREVHRRIFQELPGYGPGQYRPDTPEHGKTYQLENSGSYSVSYANRREVEAGLSRALSELGGPQELRGLTAEQFSARMAKLYGDLDYLHPFQDGNTRTLQAFTEQLAAEAGHRLDWRATDASAINAARAVEVTQRMYPGLDKERAAMGSANEYEAYKVLSRFAGAKSLEAIIKESTTMNRQAGLTTPASPQATGGYTPAKGGQNASQAATAQTAKSQQAKPQEGRAPSRGRGR